MRISLTGKQAVMSRLRRLGSNYEPFLQEAASTLIAEITKEAHAGRGTNGAMPPYKPRTIQQRKRAGYQVNHRDLTQTGQMMAAMTIIKSSPKKVNIGFANANAQTKAIYNQKLARWFGMTAKRERLVIAVFSAAFNKYVRSL